MTARRCPKLIAACVVVAGAYAGAVAAQRTDAFVVSRDHPAIDYTKGPVATRVDQLNRRLAEGTATLAFDEKMGYLPSALQALGIPAESQVAVFAQNSFQAPRITLTNPRTLFFNDR